MLQYLKLLFKVIKETFKGFSEFKILKMSASLSYITVFSLAPLLLVILYLFDIFLDRSTTETIIYDQLNTFIGNSSLTQLKEMISNSNVKSTSTISATVSIITLFIGATSVFAEIQDSINTIWGLRPKKQSGFWLYLKSRLMSFGVIGSLGFILLVAMGFSTLMDTLSTSFFNYYNFNKSYAIYLINFIVTAITTVLLFGSIFTILPDADIKWRQVKLASIVSTILFLLGKFLISFYISKSNISSVYGAAGSIIILMLWVYYSSAILYLGATFAKYYAIQFSKEIKPSEFAEIVQNVTIPSETNSLQSAQIEKKEIEVENNIDSEKM